MTSATGTALPAAFAPGLNVCLIATPSASMSSNRSSEFLAIIRETICDSDTGTAGFTSCAGGADTWSLQCHFIQRSDSAWRSRTMSANTSLNFARPRSIS